MTNSNMYNNDAIKAAQDGFRNSLGNPQKSLAHAAFLIEACAKLEGRNTMPIVRMIKQAKDKGRDAEAGMVWKLFNHVFDGAKRTKDKQGNVVIKIAGIQPNADNMDAIAKLVVAEKSINSKDVKALFNATAVKRAFDPKGWAERYVKGHNAQEVIDHKAELKLRLAALEAAEKAAAK